jgi:hypothetical protein
VTVLTNDAGRSSDAIRTRRAAFRAVIAWPPGELGTGAPALGAGLGACGESACAVPGLQLTTSVTSTKSVEASADRLTMADTLSSAGRTVGWCGGCPQLRAGVTAGFP